MNEGWMLIFAIGVTAVLTGIVWDIGVLRRRVSKLERQLAPKHTPQIIHEMQKLGKHESVYHGTNGKGE
jgi:hypothetical protein